MKRNNGGAMAKKNCWELKQCGREPGGAKAKELGVCAAAIETKMNGIHGGQNGGRTCWVVGGTLCGGKVQGTFAAKMANCLSCDFFKSVAAEEKDKLRLTKELLAILKSSD